MRIAILTKQGLSIAKVAKAYLEERGHEVDMYTIRPSAIPLDGYNVVILYEYEYEVMDVPNWTDVLSLNLFLPGFECAVEPQVWPIAFDSPAGVSATNMKTGGVVYQERLKDDATETGVDLLGRLRMLAYSTFVNHWPEMEHTLQAYDNFGNEKICKESGWFEPWGEDTLEQVRDLVTHFGEGTAWDFYNTLRALSGGGKKAYIRDHLGNKIFIQLVIEEESQEEKDNGKEPA